MAQGQAKHPFEGVGSNPTSDTTANIQIVWALYQTEFQANQELDTRILYWMQLGNSPTKIVLLKTYFI
jgi:hypothetical protein